MDKKKIIYEFIDECWNKKNRESSLYDVFSSNIIHELILGKRFGKNSFKSMADDWCQSFPDLIAAVSKIEQNQDSIIVKAHVEGTYAHPLVDHYKVEKDIISKSELLTELANCQPCNQKVTYDVEEIYVFRKDQVVRFISFTDVFSIYDQIGVFLKKEAYSSQHLIKQNKSSIIDHLKTLFPVSLTSKEIECLSLNLCGFTAERAAFILDISPRTVETHIYRGLSKLECNSKLECFEVMIERQIFPIWQDLMRNILQSSEKS